MQSLLLVRGKRLYIEDYNRSCDEALLYLHGGPGASCIDFCNYQAGALSASIRVIAIDQRGVLRSDPIEEHETFGIQDIIEDCETLREQLGIVNWTVLGHSFGGYAAFKYALTYPDSVKKVIFETPCFDVRSSMLTCIRKALTFFESLENHKGMEACKTYLNKSFSAKELWIAWGRIGELLGEYRDLIYFHGIAPKAYNEMVDSCVPSPDLWVKSRLHTRKLQEEGIFFESLLLDLPSLTQPSLLIAGAHDPICCEEQQVAYKQVHRSNIIIFERSGHFPRLEEPEKYTEEHLKTCDIWCKISTGLRTPAPASKFG